MKNGQREGNRLMKNDEFKRRIVMVEVLDCNGGCVGAYNGLNECVLGW